MSDEANESYIARNLSTAIRDGDALLIQALGVQIQLETLTELRLAREAQVSRSVSFTAADVALVIVNARWHEEASQSALDPASHRETARHLRSIADRIEATL